MSIASLFIAPLCLCGNRITKLFSVFSVLFFFISFFLFSLPSEPIFGFHESELSLPCWSWLGLVTVPCSSSFTVESALVPRPFALALPAVLLHPKPKLQWLVLYHCVFPIPCSFKETVFQLCTIQLFHFIVFQCSCLLAMIGTLLIQSPIIKVANTVPQWNSNHLNCSSSCQPWIHITATWGDGKSHQDERFHPECWERIWFRPGELLSKLFLSLHYATNVTKDRSM